jgi:putative inorganic carbon (hco3(-)) transporter
MSYSDPKFLKSESISWWKEIAVLGKFNSVMGFVFLILVCLPFAFLAGHYGLKEAALLFGGLIGLFFVGISISNPMFGIGLVLSIAFVLEAFTKMVHAPLGTSLDGLILVMLLGLLVSQVKEKNWSWIKSPISILVILWVYYNFLQVLNPWAQSKMAWLYTIRTMAVFILLYFVCLRAFDSLNKIKFMYKLIMFWALIAALYGWKQEIFGLSSSELAWLYADEERFQLIFQWTRYRIFSMMADPTTFGILMSYLSLMFLVFLMGPLHMWQKILLGVSIPLMLAGMGFSGTRTSMVMLPAGIMFIVLATLNRTIIIFSGIILLLGTAVIIKGSNSSPVIYRLRSAFKPAEDDSMKFRYKNQKFIQPFIHSHPLGAGLGSTGLWGRRFTPDSMLAKFPHDSAYVRVAVELGWVGLILYMTLLFVAFKEATYYYIRCTSEYIKTHYLAIMTMLAVLILASYPQETLPHLPNSIIFYINLAAIVRLKDFDPEYIKWKNSEQSHEQ